MADMKKVSWYGAPLTGATVNIPNFDGAVGVAFVDPAGLLATLTINLPSNPLDGQIIRIVSSKTLTILSLATAVGSILSAVTTLLGNTSIAYAWSENSQQWFRV